MNRRKDIDFDECYRRHFPRHNDNNEDSSSDGDSQLDEEDRLDRPVSLLDLFNDTIEYCASEPQSSVSSDVITKKKKKKKKKGAQEKPPEQQQPDVNRFSCLLIESDEPEVNSEKPQINGVVDCLDVGIHVSNNLAEEEFMDMEEVVSKKNKKKKAVQDKNNQLTNGFEQVSKDIGAIKKQTPTVEDLIYGNTSSSGSNLLQNNVAEGKKSKKKKKNVMQVPSPVSDNNPTKDSSKENTNNIAFRSQVTLQKIDVQTGAVKKNSAASAKVQNPQMNDTKKTETIEIQNSTLPILNESTRNGVYIGTEHPDNVQNLLQSMDFPNMFPELAHLRFTPLSHYSSRDIHFPTFKPVKSNLDLKNFPPLKQPADLRLNTHNFPPLQPHYFTKSELADEDIKIAEFAIKTETLQVIKQKMRKRNKRKVKVVAEVPQSMGQTINNKATNASEVSSLIPNIHIEGFKTTVVYQCAMPEIQECKDLNNTQNTSITSTESNPEWNIEINKDKELNLVDSPSVERVELAKLNQSFDSVLSKSDDNYDNMGDSSKFPLDEDYTECLAERFLSGSLSMEQLWYVELGQLEQRLYILDEVEKKPKKSRNRKKKSEANKLPKTESLIEVMNIDAGSYINSDPDSVEEFDNKNTEYISMQLNPEELSISYIYTSVNESLIAFCDDYISKNHVKPMLDNNTGLVTVKSSPRLLATNIVEHLELMS